MIYTEKTYEEAKLVAIKEFTGDEVTCEVEPITKL